MLCQIMLCVCVWQFNFEWELAACIKWFVIIWSHSHFAWLIIVHILSRERTEKRRRRKKNAADISNEIENIVEWNQMLRIMICKFCQKSINGKASLAFSSESDGFHRPAIEHIIYLNREMYSYVISFLSQKQHNAIIWLDWFFPSPIWSNIFSQCIGFVRLLGAMSVVIIFFTCSLS